MKREELLALAERFEAATGPDRELDADIAEAMGIENARGMALRMRTVRAHVQRYTASLDAAMTLANGFVLLHLSDIGADGLPLCKLGDLSTTPPREWTGIAARFPLAVTAAALRARASKLGADNDDR